MAESVRKSHSKIAGISVDTYEADQPGPGLLFCHGAWVGGWIWDDFASHLAGLGYTSHVATWRGHYDSKPVRDVGDLSVLDYVEDALAVTRALDPQAVLGESMGGLVAMKVAEASPDLKGLVLMNAAPPFMVPASWEVLKAQFKYLGDLLGSKPNLPTEVDYKKLILNNVPEPQASELYKRICPDSGRALREMSFGRIKVDPKKVRCPVYCVIGHLDALIPLKAHRRVAAMFEAVVADYPQMSHHTFSEVGWESVAAGVDSWLRERVAASVA